VRVFVEIDKAVTPSKSARIVYTLDVRAAVQFCSPGPRSQASRCRTNRPLRIDLRRRRMASIRRAPGRSEQCHPAPFATLCSGTEPNRERLGILAWQLSRPHRLGHLRADRRGLLLGMERLHPRRRYRHFRDQKAMGKGHHLSRLVLLLIRRIKDDLTASHQNGELRQYRCAVLPYENIVGNERPESPACQTRHAPWDKRTSHIWGFRLFSMRKPKIRT